MALTFNVEGLHHIVVDQLEVLVADPVLHVSLPASEEVVHHSHFMAVHHELVGEMGAHEARSSSYLQHVGHPRESTGEWGQSTSRRHISGAATTEDVLRLRGGRKVAKALEQHPYGSLQGKRAHHRSARKQ